MQDEIVSRLANTLDAQLIAAEARRAERSPHPDAMDLYFQGMAWLNKGLTPEHLTQARGFFERALALDPGNVEALVGMAIVDLTMGAYLLTDDRSCAFCGSRNKCDQSACPSPRTMHWPTWSWVASTFLQTARPKGSLNASRHWRLIAIWPCPCRDRFSQIFYGSRCRDRRPYSARPSVSPLAISLPTGGCIL